MFLNFGLHFLNFLVIVGAFESGHEMFVVEAVAGEKAEIPCKVPTPLEDDEASLILWYKVDASNPIYTLDIRKFPFKGAKHFPSNEMGSRAEFDVNLHPPVLVLNPVLPEDEGDYKCRVDLRRSRTLILLSRLIVIVPPSNPILMDEHGQHLYDVIGPYDEGSNLTFICEVDGGDPFPNVTWWQGTTLLDDSFNVTTKGFVRNEMLIPEIQRSDLMTEYTCKASNTNLTHPKEAKIQVDINLLPLDVRISLPKPILIAGEEYEILCESRGSRPRALITWWLDGQKIGLGPPDPASNETNLTYSILHYTPRPEDDGKYLICKSYNPSYPKVVIEDESVLSVQFKPLVNISLGTNLTKYGIIENDDVFLDCTIWANPWISQLTWQFEKRNLTTDKAGGIYVQGQSLIVRNVRKTHRGMYRCLATNEVGEGYSKDLRLYVLFAPVCRSNKTKIYGISLTETLNVTCDIEADPRVMRIRWSFNNSKYTESLTNWTEGGPKSIFRYSPQSEEGYGVLLCWGKNRIGVQKEPCAIKVVPAGAPDPPHDCSIINQTAKSLHIECEPGYNGSLTQIFHMEVYDSVMQHMSSNLSNYDRPDFHVAGLVPGSSYVIVIYASNIKGKSSSVALVGTTLLPAEKRTAETESSSINPMFFILLGVGGLLIVSAFGVLVIVRCQRSSTEERKDLPLQSTSMSCEDGKKDFEEPQESNGKGPDIIPMSKDTEVFFMAKVTDETMFSIKPEESNGEYVRQKYTDTVL